MTPDPYPDLPGGGTVDRTELSEADSRLLDALSQPTTPVVQAVEDEPRPTDGGTALLPPGRRGAAAPVFQEPSTAEQR